MPRPGTNRTNRRIQVQLTHLGRLPTLVELYCGNGNHTCALASRFARAVAVEIEPTLVAAARENFKVNGVDNADVRALPAEVFSRDETDKVASEWLTNAETEGVILVDPPRAGCDEDTLRLVARFRACCTSRATSPRW